jgi:hypothetical protein
MYIFRNERLVGLAFHIQLPYPKPLYSGKLKSDMTIENLVFLVVSFNSNVEVTISRSQQIPTTLNHTPLQLTWVEGNWKIVDYPEHSEWVSCELAIKRKEQGQHMYDLYTSVVNSLSCSLKYNPTTHEWKSAGGM